MTVLKIFLLLRLISIGCFCSSYEGLKGFKAFSDCNPQPVQVNTNEAPPYTPPKIRQRGGTIIPGTEQAKKLHQAGKKNLQKSSFTHFTSPLFSLTLRKVS